MAMNEGLDYARQAIMGFPPKQQRQQMNGGGIQSAQPIADTKLQAAAAKMRTEGIPEWEIQEWIKLKRGS